MSTVDATLPLNPRGGPTFWSRVTETISMFHEILLMACDIRSVVPSAECSGDVVVVVHGFCASAGAFRPMRRRLVQGTSATVASFTYAPGRGIEHIARSLAAIVDQVPRGCRVHVVGHSLGGLVARWYVQELGGHAHVTQTISLGSPFGGTERARHFPVLVGHDLCRTSELLARLRARAHEHDVPHTSIVGEGDRLIVPSESAVFPRGDVVVLPQLGHNTLLFHPDSISAVIERIRLFSKPLCSRVQARRLLIESV